MCGRFARTRPTREYAEAFGLTDPDNHRPWGDYAPNWNVAPGTFSLLFLWRWDRVVPVSYRWSKPFWARAETIDAKWPAFRSRRCVIPADGYYEWQQTPQGKVPHYVSFPGGRPMAIAGLYVDGPEGTTSGNTKCVVVTAGPCATLKPIHHRMPLLLDVADIQCWLHPELRNPEALLEPYCSDLQVWPVSTRVNAAANNAPDLIMPVEHPSAHR